MFKVSIEETLSSRKEPSFDIAGWGLIWRSFSHSVQSTQILSQRHLEPQCHHFRHEQHYRFIASRYLHHYQEYHRCTQSKHRSAHYLAQRKLHSNIEYSCQSLDSVEGVCHERWTDLCRQQQLSKQSNRQVDTRQNTTLLTHAYLFAVRWSVHRYQQQSLLFSRHSESSAEEIPERSSQCAGHRRGNWL